jgi:hypothetical protein
MTFFLNTRFSELDATEMQEWYDSNPIANELVINNGGVGFYFDEDLALQTIMTGRTQVFCDDVDTYTSTTWSSPLINCYIVALFIDGVLQRDIGTGSPAAGEFTYDFTTGQFDLNAALSGEIITVQYVQSWEPTVV